jgi:hypothetical protein
MRRTHEGFRHHTTEHSGGRFGGAAIIGILLIKMYMISFFSKNEILISSRKLGFYVAQ